MNSIDRKSLISKVSPFFGVSLAFWLIILGIFIKPILFFAIITIPVFTVALVISFFCFRTRFNLVGVFVWSAPLALLIIMVLAQLILFVSPTSSTYYFGMDIMTPNGLKSCKSMVRIDTDYLTENWIPTFTMRGHRVMGEAIYCNLDDGKNIIATLAFENRGKDALRRLPSLAYESLNAKDREASSSKSVRMELVGQNIPIIVSFTDINNPMSMQLVNPDNIAAVFGEGYSLKNIWIQRTEEDYQPTGIEKKLPWINSKSDTGAWMWVYPFRKYGLHVYWPFKRNM